MRYAIAAVLASCFACLAGAQPHPCPADTNVDGQLTSADFTSWIFAYNTGVVAIADQNGDGLATPTDFSAWIANYNAGCDFTDDDGDRIPTIYENNTGISGPAYATGTDPFNPDSDGDNIEDGDEAYGTIDGLDLPGMGADANHKTIFIEIDWTDDSWDTAFHSHRPRPGMESRIVAAFANAPLTNPDGQTGVDLILDYGQGGLFDGGEELFVGQNIHYLLFSDALTYRDTYMDQRRRGIFHYGIFTHQYNSEFNFSSGVAYLFSDVFYVTIYQYWADDVAASNTLMHELGHNLGLHHGGDEPRNYKPNYNSVLNYKFQFPGIDLDCDGSGDGVLDYSRGLNADLVESALVEADGICGVPIDWSQNGIIDPGTVAFNINCQSLSQLNFCGSTGSCYDDTCDTLRDTNDWAILHFLGQARTPNPERIDCNNPHPMLNR
ncbi:MAG TPA: hypothetical protein ENJ00_10180 [Phycisphaerales bacterium]|nr:hypothetical protein [Phycisphaerales bacterium]